MGLLVLLLRVDADGEVWGKGRGSVYITTINSLNKVARTTTTTTFLNLHGVFLLEGRLTVIFKVDGWVVGRYCTRVLVN